MKKKEKKDKAPKTPVSRGNRIYIYLIVAVALIVSIALTVTIVGQKDKVGGGEKTSVKDSVKIGESREYDGKGEGGALSSVEIAEKVKPSVIAIIVTDDTGEDTGEGSGVVMSVNKEKDRTYILTCAHIIAGKDKLLQVQTENGDTYDASVVGYDLRNDIGVISIKGTSLKPAEFGNSKILKVGEPVYAIGNPGGSAFYGSVTSGIISAIDRPTPSSGSAYSMECIQHDAAINPGNSGGALVNSYGQVIGINSSKISSKDYEGMGFAVPISVAKDVADELMSKGYVQNRAKLGIKFLPASDHRVYAYIVEKNDLPKGSLIIAEIEPDSSLSGTKARPGDLIIAVDGKNLTKKDVLLDVIEHSKPGNRHTLKIAHVNEDYSVSTFDVKIKLMEDKGAVDSQKESEKDSEGGKFVNPFMK